MPSRDPVIRGEEVSCLYCDRTGHRAQECREFEEKDASLVDMSHHPDWYFRAMNLRSRVAYVNSSDIMKKALNEVDAKALSHCLARILRHERAEQTIPVEDILRTSQHWFAGLFENTSFDTKLNFINLFVQIPKKQRYMLELKDEGEVRR